MVRARRGLIAHDGLATTTQLREWVYPREYRTWHCPEIRLPAALVSRRLPGPGEFHETRPLYECNRLQYQRVRNGGRSPEFVE
jgi:hypothetical protein